MKRQGKTSDPSKLRKTCEKATPDESSLSDAAVKDPEKYIAAAELF
jgi:hypothetical protein